MTYSFAFLLQILFGIYGLDGGNADYKQAIYDDPGIATELGIDPNCMDCDLDYLKLKMIELEQKKAAGGITGDNLGA